MSTANNASRAVAKAYFDAMADRNVEKILALSAENVVCKSPLGTLNGQAQFRGFQEGFAKMIEKLTLVAAFGEGEQAAIVYTADTLPVKNAMVVEYLVVKDGKIVSTDVVYDGTPFAAYAASAQAH